MEEVTNLLNGDLSGKQEPFGKILIKQLFFIKALGHNVYKADSNEILKHTDKPYYSLHLSGKGFNVRFLIYIDDTDTTYLLCAFNERGGKRKTGYANYIPVLEKRLEEMGGLI